MAEVAERWQRWQKGCYMVRIPFLCYLKQGSGEQPKRKPRGTTEKETEKGKKKKEKAGGLFWYIHYNLL